MRTQPSLVAALIASLTLTSCREPQPVAHLEAAPAKLVLSAAACHPVALRWQILRPLENLHGQPKVFVHLYNEERGMVRAYDHLFPAPWAVGSIVEETVEICDASDLPPVPDGTYILRFGLYDSEWGYRWRLDDPGREDAPRAYSLVHVEVQRWRRAP